MNVFKARLLALHTVESSVCVYQVQNTTTAVQQYIHLEFNSERNDRPTLEIIIICLSRTTACSLLVPSFGLLQTSPHYYSLPV